ncbi:MAG TPA: AAA family ATPase, partial [Mycobacterium sp.]|nr:AAA family ATPase [Mycobacterium sp.]
MSNDSAAAEHAMSARIHETHSGIIVLVGDKAYKAKKPVTTEFLDFSTPARREQVCAREVELNSRLAPASYLGVAHLTLPGGGPPEPVIVMRRHPDAARLATMVRGSDPSGAVAAALHAIAATVAGFHDTARRGRPIDAQGTVTAVGRRWQDNFTEMAAFTGEVISAVRLQEIRRLAAAYLAGRSVLFTRRITDRRIVDGHGDLLADDIFWLPDGVQILDCLEFDDNLRYVDVIDDIAFLAMDLEFLGRRDLADIFVEEYRAATDDDAPASLLGFYVAYRALVRAKTDCVRFTQGHTESRPAARRHLDIAIDQLRALTVRLTLVGGGPGTGKTTLAHHLAEQVGAEVVSTDEIRRELQDSGEISGAAGTLDAGLYAPQHVDAVYAAMFRRARLLLA